MASASLVFFLLALLVRPSEAGAYLVSGPFCYTENVYGSGGSLPACAFSNSTPLLLNLTSITASDGPRTCSVHSVVTVTLHATFTAQNLPFYNLAIFLGLDGRSERSVLQKMLGCFSRPFLTPARPCSGPDAVSSCSATILYPVTSNASLVNSLSGLGPWRASNSDGCGDLPIGGGFVVTFPNVQLQCEDPLSRRAPTVQALVTWQQIGPFSSCNSLLSSPDANAPGFNCSFTSSFVSNMDICLEQAQVSRALKSLGSLINRCSHVWATTAKLTRLHVKARSLHEFA